MKTTPHKAVREYCLACVGATKAGGAFDCLSQICSLYPAHPFRGKPMPKSKRPPVDKSDPEWVALAAESDAEWANRQREADAKSRRRATKALIEQYCRHACQPGDTSDCGGTDCAFYPLRPWEGPGKQAKHKRSEAQIRRDCLATAASLVRRRKVPSEGQFTRKQAVA